MCHLFNIHRIETKITFYFGWQFIILFYKSKKRESRMNTYRHKCTFFCFKYKTTEDRADETAK